MAPVIISLIAFVFIFGGVLFGVFLRRKLPTHLLNTESKEAVRLATGLIATLAALVLGLLTASAKTSYDTREGQIRQLTAGIILLDNLLARVGPDAQTARIILRRGVRVMVDRIWRDDGAAPARGTSFAASAATDGFYEQLQQLSTKTDVQSSLKTRAMQISNELAQTRLVLYAETGSSIPPPFLMVLVFWLTMIFISFSVFAPPNEMVVAALFICALSASGSIFLILDLNQPFSGLMTISSAPLRNALPPLAPS